MQISSSDKTPRQHKISAALLALILLGTPCAGAAQTTAQLPGKSPVGCESACGFRLSGSLGGGAVTSAATDAVQARLPAATQALRRDGFALLEEHQDLSGNITQVWHNPVERLWARLDITRSGQVAVQQMDAAPV